MTLVCNLYGGPGSGKSTTAAGLFYRIKKHQLYSVELVTEFAKDLTWEERHNVLSNQPYILGKQYHRLMRLKDKVDIIVTDSPLLLNIIYNDNKIPELDVLTKALYKQFDNFDVFLLRSKIYDPLGRNQTEDEARQIDTRLRSFLENLGVELHIAGTDDINVDVLGWDIERIAHRERQRKLSS